MAHSCQGHAVSRRGWPFGVWRGQELKEMLTLVVWPMNREGSLQDVLMIDLSEACWVGFAHNKRWKKTSKASSIIEG